MSFEQLVRLDLQHVGKLFDRVERCGIDLSLERRNIGPINSGEIRQCFLRQLSLHSDSAQVRRENLTQRHAARQTVAMTLHPRSIFYIINNKMSGAI